MHTTHSTLIRLMAGLVCLMVSVGVQAAERFVNNGNGTITDHKSKLIGLADGHCLQQKTWDEAVAEAARLASGMCGLSDGSSPGSWRLPSKRELPILLEWKKSGAFSSMHNDFYWSGTVNEEHNSLAWLLFLTTGYVGNDVKTDKNAMWPVREAP
ncbi:MAG: DUF1566 domain-containing protein [Magnetococcus sp. DMHC-8]